HADPALTLSVFITGQGEEGPTCKYYVVFNATIDNQTGGPVVVQSVDYGAYNDPNFSEDGGLHAGTILEPGYNYFNGNSHNGASDGPPCNQHPPPPLVLTVQTDHGTLVWDQRTSPMPGAGPIGGLGVALLAGVALVASQRRSCRVHSI